MPSPLPPVPRIKIVDVGAMAIEGESEAYAKLVAALPCDVIGFEPQANECAKLRALNRAGHTYLPYVIGDGSRQVFHTCNYPPTSSLFEPNTALLDQFQNLENLTQVVQRTAVGTVRLDEIPECDGTDFLKLDVQGAELLILAGAEETLKNAVVLQTEVEFVSLYIGQPLFADVDRFLRAHGFVFHLFCGLGGRTFKPLVHNHDVNAPLSQMLWAEAVYVRDFMRFDELTPGQLLKLAAILHTNYQSIDLAARALKAYDEKERTDFLSKYFEGVVSKGPPSG